MTPSISRWRKYLNDARTFPDDARLGWTRERWRGVWAAVATRTLHRVIRADRLIVFAQPLDRVAEAPLPEGVTISTLTPAQFPLMAYLISRRELEWYRQLLANGRICIVAWRDDRAVGYAWVAERLGPDVTRCPIPLPPDAVYLWDLYVLPSERGNGVGTALAAARLSFARELGFREGWRMIKPSNAASLRTLRSGTCFRVVGEVRFLQVMSILRARFIPCPLPSSRS